jgi:hypothetical protein
MVGRHRSNVEPLVIFASLLSHGFTERERERERERK